MNCTCKIGKFDVLCPLATSEEIHQHQLEAKNRMVLLGYAEESGGWSGGDFTDTHTTFKGIKDVLP